MSRNCCCGKKPRPEAFCCNDIFFTDFITLYGDTLAEHAEVSPKDWIALHVYRNGVEGSNSFFNSHNEQPSQDFECNCLADPFTGACPPNDPPWYIPRTELGETLGRRSCCQRFISQTEPIPAKPIYFAYKYTGCHFIWYPREFSFGTDVYVPQCTSFRSRIQIEEGVFQNVINSCHRYTQQAFQAGAAGTWPSECGLVGPITENDTILSSSYTSATPCACSSHPHIHGGLYDSLYNRVNVKLTPGQLGYVPFLLPFAEPMTGDEVNCCWCANSSGVEWEAFLKARLGCFANSYPKSDGSGRTLNINDQCGPGFDCARLQNDMYSMNPTYYSYCYARGISPYLWRISKTQYKMAHDIWGYGFPTDEVNNVPYLMDFGVSYEVRNIQINDNNKQLDLEFKKFTGKRTRLRDQLIGIVHLEHHFEMYAYRSDIGSAALEIQALQNHCNVLLPDYEQYGGAVTKRGSFHRWTPWKFDNIMWQVRRSVPRRVMYKGSGIPIFQFDLVNMENKSYDKGILYEGDPFDGATFLRHYYRYFFGLIYFNEGSCKYIGDTPVAPEWDFSHFLNSYEYVIYWIEKMVEEGVLRIKDHAIDISKEVNNFILGGSVLPNGEIAVAEAVAKEVGGYTGYVDLIRFFGVTAGTPNATTPKIIKNKLLSVGKTTWYGPSGKEETFRAFLPRRAILPLSPTLNGITAWGFTGNRAILENTNYGITGAPSLVTEASFVDPILDRQDFRDLLSPQKVISGLMGHFIIDASGKIFALGSDDLEPPLQGGCGDPYENWQPRIGCIPYYLRIDGIYKPDPDAPEGVQRFIRREPEEIPDGNVINVAFKRDFVVAQFDTFNSALGLNCNLFSGGNLTYLESYENNAPNDEEYSGPNANVNGNNETVIGFDVYKCLPDDPFFAGSPGIPPVNAGPRGGTGPLAEVRKPNAYRLKSWGSKAKQYGTFSGSKVQAGLSDDITVEPILYLRWNSEINPVLNGEYDSKKYPGNNNFHIWTEISSGVKHFAAIDDRNGLFITPGSDNTFKQSSKGMGVTYSSGYKQALEKEAQGYENVFADSYKHSGHIGLGSRFNYFPHIPKPGYIKQEEWTQSFYNNLTLDYAYDDTSGSGFFSHYRINLGQCPVDYPDDNCRAGSGFLVPQDECPVLIYPTNDCAGESGPYPSYVRDLTTVLLGNLVTYRLSNGDYWVSSEKDTQPKYTKIACGTYNTLCLTNENKLEIYGTYVKVTPEGEPIIDALNPGITCFIPSALEAKAASWDVTYGCPVYCNGATHSPIINYSYNEPAPNNIIKEIYSSSDYSMCVTSDNKVHIWGDVSMIPGLFDPLTYQPGNIGYKVLDEILDVNQIVAVAAGINSFYVHYKKQLIVSGEEIPLISHVTYEFTRYNINGIATEVPTSIRSARIIDIGAGYLHAVALYSKSLDSNVWNFNQFAKNSQSFQFKNFERLPFYFRRQAFFHALPGGWDYSKWLYGSICCNSLENPTSNPVLKPDICSVLRYNIFNDTEDILLSYSGNPQYFWHRRDWRRSTFQSTDLIPFSSDPSQPNKCRPDIQLDVQQGAASFNMMSAAVGDCLRGYGLAWGTGRPRVNAIRTEKFKAAQSCRESCTGVVSYVNPSPQYALAFTSLGVDVNPSYGYRATKDLFQKMAIFYGNEPRGTTDFAVCPEATGYGWSYFKYAERHYYLGYDREKDTWEIYDNPDFLKETAHAQPSEDLLDQEISDWDKSELGTGWRQCGVIGTPSRLGFGGGGETFACCNEHFTTTILGQTCSNDFKILKDYPLTGPNYPLENITETPVVVSPPEIAIQMDLAQGEISSDDPCTSASCPSGRTLREIRPYLGPGGFMFTGGPQGSLPYGSNGFHIYNLTLKRTDYPHVLLKGVKTNLSSATIPPNQSNTDYTKTSFDDVLRNPNLTIQDNPWYSNSTKWTPICWRTPTFIEGTETTSFSGKDFYFNYSISQDISQNIKQISEDKVKNPKALEIEYDLEDLTIVEPNPVPTNDPSWSPNDEDNVRLLQTFITDLNVPNSLLLKKGLFQFFVMAKPRFGTVDPMYLFVQVLKYNPDTEQETLIFETSRIDTNIADTAGGVGIDPNDPDAPPQARLIYKEHIMSYYLSDDIPLELNDRIMVKLLLRGGLADAPPTTENDELDTTEAVYILYEDPSNFMIPNPDDSSNPIDSGVPRYSRMKHSILEFSVNEVCITSFSLIDGEAGFGNDEANNTLAITFGRATSVDPNIVRLVFGPDGQPYVQGPLVACGFIPCCGE